MSHRSPLPRTSRRAVDRDSLWPFVYWPLIWILLIHVGTRVAWLLGFG